MFLISEPIMADQPHCTVYTAAPESWHFAQPYEMRIADVYSVGAVLLTMLLGCYAFAPSPACPENDVSAVCTQMKKDRHFITELLRPFNHTLKRLLLRTLEPIPRNRISIEEFLADNWFTQRMESQELEERKESTLWKGLP